MKFCKDLARYFKKSGLNTRLTSVIKQEVSTRWNSLYIMLNSIKLNFNTIKEVLKEQDKYTKLQDLSVYEVSINDLVNFLRNFKEIFGCFFCI